MRRTWGETASYALRPTFRDTMRWRNVRELVYPRRASTQTWMMLTFAFFVGLAVVGVGLYAFLILQGQVRDAARETVREQAERLAVQLEAQPDRASRLDLAQQIAELTQVDVGIATRDEVIGDFGVLGDGAAGIELDGVDESLGSPPDTIVLARSTGHSAYYMQSPDEIVFNHAAVTGDTNERVRADMIYSTLPSGAGVFATGSISWAASLGWNGYDNNVAKLTGNVLRRFEADEALP